ncbi:MAG: hypothetical protein JXR52_06195 [Bacteroidales bacterium]|nr:hypothetical protein [Bacteroidales bacterium]MBN2698398.1 hypothetical protein [Bacteroidales bacterium]
MTISEYQKKCYREYKSSIGYPGQYTYLYGNPVNPVVPVETVVGRVMIVGAYPSARLYTVDGIRDLPLYDSDAPFSDEVYFDGCRVRSNPSGQELNEVILEPIGVERGECWITDLVKIALFKEEQVKKYKKLGKENIEENRSLFMEYGKKSLDWLREEIDLANPKVIILLGSEVIKTILDVSEKEARDMMIGEMFKKEISWKAFNIICLPHPKILMKKISKNPWPLKFEVSIAPMARKEIARLLR